MNGLQASLKEVSAMNTKYDSDLRQKVDMLICTPATLISSAAQVVVDSYINIGGEDCHANESGAHTGDVSAEMLKDAGATAVIVGHSERRTDHGESNATVKAKAEAGLRAGLLTIVCIGETEAERKSGDTLGVLKEQLDGSMPDGASASEVVVDLAMKAQRCDFFMVVLLNHPTQLSLWALQMLMVHWWVAQV